MMALLYRLGAYNKKKTKFMIWHPVCWLYLIIVMVVTILWILYEPIKEFLCWGIINKQTWIDLWIDFKKLLRLYNVVGILK